MYSSRRRACEKGVRYGTRIALSSNRAKRRPGQLWTRLSAGYRMSSKPVCALGAGCIAVVPLLGTAAVVRYSESLSPYGRPFDRYSFSRLLLLRIVSTTAELDS